MANSKLTGLTEATSLATTDEIYAVVGGNSRRASVQTLLKTEASLVTITGGTIDGTVIGGVTPAAVSGTTGQFGTSLNVDGTVTADGLTVDGAPSSSVVIKDDDSFLGADNQIKLAIAPSIANGESAGVAFGTFSSDDYWKQGIFWQRTATFGVGDLIFANRESADTTTVTDADQRIRVARNGDISFYENTGTTPKFFWDASAESLGIGGASTAAALETRGNDSSFRGFDAAGNYGLQIYHDGAAGISKLKQTNSGGDLMLEAGTSSGLLFFNTAGSERMRIDSSGGLILVGSTAQKATGTTWSNPSDQRLKTDIRDYTKGSAELMQVRVREWLYNGKGGTVDGMAGLGVIADEVMTVLPDTVETYEAFLEETDELPTAIKKFDATEITWLLVTSLQEALNKIEAMEVRLSALEAQEV
jgi:hypothetical protein